MARVDCNALEQEHSNLANKVISGLRQKDEFDQAYEFEISERDTLEQKIDDHIVLEIHSDKIDYEDLDNEIIRVRTDKGELEILVGILEIEWNAILDERDRLSEDLSANDILIGDYQSESDAFDCDSAPNAGSPHCVSLNEMVVMLKQEQTDWWARIGEIDARLLDIPDEVSDLEDDIAELQTMLDDLNTFAEDEKEHQRDKVEYTRLKSILDDNKKVNFPEAYDLEENNIKLNKVFDKLLSHCANI